MGREKQPKRKQPRRKAKVPTVDDASSGWVVDATPVEPVRLRPISPSLWEGTLHQLRDDFLAARQEHGPLRCPLFHTSTSQADAQKPPFNVYAGSVAAHSSVYHNFRQYTERNGRLIYLEHPIVDADGESIVDAQARGLMCAMPASRKWFYGGTLAAGTRFGELAERGGLALLGSSEPIISWIPYDTIAARIDEHRWVWSLFDLAWQGRHPALHAERRTWFRCSQAERDVQADVVYAPYDIQRLRALRDAVFDFPEAWLERLPGYFTSALPDLFQASADLIDTLLDSATRCAGEERSDRESTTAAEPTAQVKQVGAKEGKAGGRPCLSEAEAQKRTELLDRWNRAKTQGVHQKDFCHDEAIDLKYLTKCINWHTQRRRRQHKP